MTLCDGFFSLSAKTTSLAIKQKSKAGFCLTVGSISFTAPTGKTIFLWPYGLPRLILAMPATGTGCRINQRVITTVNSNKCNHTRSLPIRTVEGLWHFFG